MKRWKKSFWAVNGARAGSEAGARKLKSPSLSREMKGAAAGAGSELRGSVPERLRAVRSSALEKKV